jgi:hypothetical protein
MFILPIYPEHPRSSVDTPLEPTIVMKHSAIPFPVWGHQPPLPQDCAISESVFCETLIHDSSTEKHLLFVIKLLIPASMPISKGLKGGV